jgi:hypothetical protein
MSVTSVNILAPLTGGTITSSGFVGMNQANGSTDGFLSSFDWSLFNDKVGGSGTTNNIPKWATSSTLGDSLLINGSSYVQVGSFTPSAVVISAGVTVMNLNVFGTNGLYINDITLSYNKQGIYPNGSQLEFFLANTTTGIGDKTCMINNTTTNTAFEVVKGFENTAGTSINIDGGIQPSVSNSSNFTMFSVTPPISQTAGGGVIGSGEIRAFYYNPTITSLGTSIHRAWENTYGDIVYGHLTGTNTEAVTILSTGKLIKQSTLTAINLYDGSTAKGLQVDFANTTYILGNTATSTAGINIQSGHIHGIFSNLTDGLSMTYSNHRFQFGQIDSTTYTDFFFYVRGNQERAYINYSGIDNGLIVDFRTGQQRFVLGDDKGINPNNKNYILANDVVGIGLETKGNVIFNCGLGIRITTSQITLTGVNLTSSVAPSNRADNLEVTVNSTPYKIQLWDI